MRNDMDTLPALISELARRSPDTVAVASSDGQLTFAELDTGSNRFARWLRDEHGVDRERVVGVCLPRTETLLTVLLGIMKAGGAYLPLDQKLPVTRRAYMIEEAEAAPVITAEELQANWPKIESTSGAPSSTPIDPAQLAYVIYTSGSTGKPKGVMVEHGQLMAYLEWASEAYLATGRGAPFHAPLTFDLSVTMMFGPLVAGRTVHMLPFEDLPVSALPAALAEGEFSFVKITPAHLELLSEALSPETMAAATERLVVGGEALGYQQLDTWARHADGTLLINEYGPTEAVVGCCTHTEPLSEAASRTGPVPIGRAAPGTRLTVLDEALEPVGVDEIGELFIGGVQVARGYLRKPGQTARSFLPDPQVTGRRMYRTGDLVRKRSDGTYVFVGRRDSQLKLRGYRIEPAEIESALTQHPDVTAAAVTVCEHNATEGLVAYVVPRADAALEPHRLREHLAKLVPDYMLPVNYVELEVLPLTSNGKVDRSALPDPTPSGAETGIWHYSSSLEAAVAQVFSEILGGQVTSSTSNFFALGGNSLQAARIIARLSRVHDIDLPAQVWMQSPTVAGFTHVIDTYLRLGRDAALRLEKIPDLDVDLDNEIIEELQDGVKYDTPRR